MAGDVFLFESKRFGHGGKLENVNWDQINTVKCGWPVISVVAPGNSRLFLLPRREWGRGGKCGEF